MICQDIKCPDYLTDDGEPAWCYRAGMPAQVAVLKCQTEAVEMKVKEKAVKNETKTK
jgi:hypothetical protein